MRIFIFILLIILDRSLKYFFVTETGGLEEWAIVKGLSIIISILIITLLVIRYKSHLAKYWYPMLLIGGSSNIIDIIIYGKVVDYIPLFNYILNFSDIIISVGIVILVFDIYKYENSNK